MKRNQTTYLKNAQEVKERFIKRLQESQWGVTYFNYNYHRETNYECIDHRFFLETARNILGDKFKEITIFVSTGSGRVHVNVYQKEEI